jgi:hypothetical protein
MFLASFYVPAVAGEAKLSFAAGTQATLTEVSACTSGAKAAKLSVEAGGTAVLKDESTGKKGAPEVFGCGVFPEGQPFHIAKGALVDLVLKAATNQPKGDEKAPVEGVTVVLTFA